MQEDEKKFKKCHRRGEDKSAIAVTQIKDLDSCSMGSISHEWLGVTRAKTLTPAWAICYQR